MISEEKKYEHGGRRMREIKFRAWEPETEMGKPGSMSYNQEFCLNQILHNDGIKIMQYTGMKDKNGKEIYEGDIVQQGEKDEIIWGGEGKIIRPPYGFVKYEEAGAYFDVNTIRLGIYESDGEKIENLHMNYYDGVFQWIERKIQGNIEVIGNIYQNPELLEKK